MSNPLYNGHNANVNAQMPNNNQIMQNIANDLNYLKRFQSPQHFWATLEKENPEVFQKLRQLERTMQNPMQVAMYELNQRGIDLNQIAAMMQGQKM